MNYTLVTPTERLVYLSLTHTSGQTLERLSATTGTRTLKHLRSVLKTLVEVQVLSKSDTTPAIYKIANQVTL